jgi:threonine dehydratase
MALSEITQQDIFLARQVIAPVVRPTPLVFSQPLSEMVGASVYFKPELLQDTGSFKIRGAANKIFNLTLEEKLHGLVTVSTGNHGRAVAHVAASAGIKASICISDRVPANKVNALRKTGVEVLVYGQSQDEAEEQANCLCDEQGMTMIHPFDDPYIIAGQGTIGLELLLDCPQIDTVLVPLSGGGLISGIALAVKAANPRIRVIGVSMLNAAVMAASLQAGKPVVLPEEDTLADSLLGGIGLNNRYTYRIVQELVDDVILVPEDAIAEAIAFVFQTEGWIVEGAGAVGVAALLHGMVGSITSHHIALILSGRNINSLKAMEIIQKHARK